MCKGNIPTNGCVAFLNLGGIMSDLRFRVVEKAFSKAPTTVEAPEERMDRVYAKHVFDKKKMFEYLPKAAYDAMIDVIDNGYAMSDEEKNAYVFEVDSENKLVLVLYRLYDYEVVYKAKTSAPTAIGGIGINKASKVVKTIENGKVVVIKNGVKYGLDGSVIK